MTDSKSVDIDKPDAALKSPTRDDIDKQMFKLSGTTMLLEDAEQSTKSNKTETSSYVANKDNESLDEKISQTAPMCRICHCEETSEEFLITPCYCSGTLKFVHQSCLQQWLKSNGI
jgi:hypothetical protein